MKRIVIFVVVAVVIVCGVWFAFAHRGTASPAAVPSLSSISVTEAPWAPEITNLKERLAALGLPALSAEGTALHIHQHLDIFVHGQVVAIPAGIGIHETYPPFISPIHVHDTGGVIHVESPTVETFMFGQFFDIWGVRLSSTCMGAYCTDGSNALRIYVNGQPYANDPRTIVLSPHQEIVITFGTATETPQTIPSTYAFPTGE